MRRLNTDDTETTERTLIVDGREFVVAEEAPPGFPLKTAVYDEDGEDYMRLPGHSIPNLLLEQAIREVVSAHKIGERVGRELAMFELRRLIGCAGEDPTLV